MGQQHTERWVMGMLVLQLLAGMLMLVVTTSGGNALGPFAETAVTLLGWLASKQRWLSGRSVLLVAMAQHRHGYSLPLALDASVG